LYRSEREDLPADSLFQGIEAIKKLPWLKFPGADSKIRVTKLDMVTAYDGDRVQILNNLDGTLSLQSVSSDLSRVQPTMSVQTIMYLWLHDASCTFPDMTTIPKCAWENRLAAPAKVIARAEESDGLVTLEMPQLLSKGGRGYYRVKFDPSLGYAPVESTKYTLPAREVAHRVKLMDFQECESGDRGESIWFPTSVAFEQSGADRSTKMTILISISPDTVRLNEHIDDSQFSIDPGLAKRIYDVDEVKAHISRKVAESNFDLLGSTSGTRFSSTRISLLLVNILLVAVIGAILYFRKREG
jgi:hypothetical protein